MNDTEPRPTLLFIDDEERILRSLNLLFRPRANVLSTTDPDEALRLVGEHRVDVVVSDQRMPEILGAELLARIREVSPHSVRILLTGYSDIDAAIGAVNNGEIWRYLNKPWSIDGIQSTIRDAVACARAAREGAASPRPAAPAPARIDVLVVDEDPRSAEAVRQVVPPGATVHVAANLTQAVEILGRHPVGVVVAEILVGGDDITHLLRSLKQRYPDVVGIVLTEMRDTPRLVRLINQAQLFRYLPKPLRPGMLARAVEAGLQRHVELRRSAVVPPPELRVEEAATEVERTLSRRIGDYLARLKGRSGVATAGS